MEKAGSSVEDFFRLRGEGHNRPHDDQNGLYHRPRDGHMRDLADRACGLAARVVVVPDAPCRDKADHRGKRSNQQRSLVRGADRVVALRHRNQRNINTCQAIRRILILQ